MLSFRKIASLTVLLAIVAFFIVSASRLDAFESGKKSFETWKQEAEQGDAEAQVHLGKSYDYGVGVPQDYKEAVKWYRKAAEQGHASAQNSLGILYRYGNGIAQDKKEAVKWFRKSAEQGDPLGQFNLGQSYYFGEGVPRDYKEAVKWYRKAAEQGDASAQLHLGNSYLYGEGVPQDYREAVKWYFKVVESQDEVLNTNQVMKDNVNSSLSLKKLIIADAQYNLGICYLNGKGVPQDYREAVKWIRRAAELGQTDAINALRLLNIGF